MFKHRRYIPYPYYTSEKIIAVRWSKIASINYRILGSYRTSGYFDIDNWVTVLNKIYDDATHDSLLVLHIKI